MVNAGDVIRAIDIPDFDPWIDYTPTLTSSGTAPTTSTATGSYIQHGKLVIAYCNIVIATAGTGNYSVALPVASAAVATDTMLGGAWLQDSSPSTPNVGVVVAQAANTTCQVRIHAVAAVMGATSPWTWAAGDAIRLDLMYEAA